MIVNSFYSESYNREMTNSIVTNFQNIFRWWRLIEGWSRLPEIRNVMGSSIAVVGGRPIRRPVEE
jgi:hypothetical protein